MKKDSEAETGSKLKVGLLQAEKRLIDLELSVTEFKDKLKEIDLEGLKEFKERIDDLEDLVMVENAGIIELKKMLEDMQNKFAVPEGKISEGMEKRISGIEDKITTSEKLPPAAIQEQIQTITDEINKLRDETSKELMGIKQKPVVEEKPSVDIQFLSSKINSLKSTVDEIVNKRIETELKIQTLESFLTEIRAKEELPGSLFEEIKSIRKEWLVVSGRVDSIERVVKDISETVPKLESTLKKFETFDNASLLSKELGNKLEQFKFIENETNRLSSKIEAIYSNLDKRLDKVREIEKKIPLLSDAVSNIEKEVDKNKIDILDRVKKDDIEVKIKDIRKDIINKINKDDIERIFNEMNNLRDSTNQRINELKKKTNIEEIRKELDIFKVSIGKGIDARFENLVMEVNQKTSNVQPPMFDMQMNELVNKLVFLETRLTAIERMISETSTIQPIIIE